MQKLTLLILVLLTALFVNAQSNSYYLELKIKDKLEVSDFYIENVLDKRVIKSNNGNVLIEGVNPAPSKFPGKFEEYLERKLGDLLDTKNGEPITLIIHELDVSEKNAGAPIYYLNMSVEFAKNNDGVLSSLWKKEIELRNDKISMKKMHDKQILNGFVKVLSEFNSSDWKNIKPTAVDTASYKIDFTTIPKEGLYTNFTKLVKNQPHISHGYTIQKRRKKFYPRYDIINSYGGVMSSQQVLFISDKNNLYINASFYRGADYFVIAKEIGRYIYFEDEYSDRTAGAGAAVIGGLAGGLLASAATLIPKALVLDTETGIIQVLNSKKAIDFLSDFPKIQKKFKNSEKQLYDFQDAIAEINKIYKED